MAPRRVLRAWLGTASSEVPVSTMAWQPPEQATGSPETETLGEGYGVSLPGAGRGAAPLKTRPGGQGIHCACELHPRYLSMVICQ